MLRMNTSTQPHTTKKELPAELVEVTPPIQMRISKIASYALYAWVSIGLVSLGIRVFFLLFSANREAPFVDFIYRLSSDYLAPFRGIFPPHPIGEAGYLDVAALFAIFMYLIVAWLVTSLISYVQEKIDAHDTEQRKRITYEQAAGLTEKKVVAPDNAPRKSAVTK